MTFIVYLLASWRMSRMLYDLDEDGPFDLFIWIRHHAGVYDDEPNVLAQAIVCPYCISVWCGFVLALASLNKTVFRLIAWPLAASAYVVIMYENFEGD